MTVIKQTALAGFDFDGTPGRGFVDLTSSVGIDAENESRVFVIAALSVNCPSSGTITGVRVAFALTKADADGIDSINHLVVDTNATTQWTLRGPVSVPNGYSLFVYATGGGPPQECRLLVYGGVITLREAFDL